ncbi:MAG: DUF1566 domain-containing protein [Sulfurovum sp.]|nr:DUF1566 domain-containing protein [Sulfurovum sp.]
MRVDIKSSLIVAAMIGLVGCGGGGSGGGGNTAPMAVNDTINIAAGTTGTAIVLDNDSDSDGALDSSSVAVVANSTNGTTVVNGDGSISYTPDAGYTGTDTFTYTVNDDEGAISNAATVSLTVLASNSAPTITNSASVSVLENQTSAITITATDGDGDAITYSITGGVDAGDFAINATSGVVAFTSNPDFETKPSYALTVAASDNLHTTEQNVTIAITDVFEGSSPIIVAPNATVTADENQRGAFTIQATDVDGDAITYSLSGMDAASFDINASTGVVEFKTDPDYESGTTTYTVTAEASDGAATTSKDITIDINDLQGGSKVLKTGQINQYGGLLDDGHYTSGREREFTKVTVGAVPPYVHDSKTDLQWKDNGIMPKKNYADAVSYCNSINGWSNQSGWRLPRVQELYSIVNRGAGSPSLFGEFGNVPTTEEYWTQTKWRGTATYRHSVDFANGQIVLAGNNNEKRVRCVRYDGFPTLVPFVRFTRSGTSMFALGSSRGVVSDRYTNLQWYDPARYIFVAGTLFPPVAAHFKLVGDASETGTYTQAINGCETLVANGKSDWRLPNVNELLSIVDFRKGTGTAFYSIFESESEDSYFTSTTVHSSPDKTSAVSVNGWALLAPEIHANKTSTRGYRCVRTVGD